jgi:hypothetical protein
MTFRAWKFIIDPSYRMEPFRISETIIEGCFNNINYSYPNLFPAINVGLPNQMHADVVLGVLEKGCSGLGVCKIAQWRSEKSRCAVTGALIEHQETGTIRFRFDSRVMCRNMIKQHFSSNIFTVEADFMLPHFLRVGLEISANQIKKGNYPIEKSNPYYWVAFSY